MKFDSFHQYVLQTFPDGSVILEFGSGFNTALLVAKFIVYTVEQDPKFLNLVPSAHYILAPIENEGWYSVDVLKNELPEIYDLVIIDGPKGGHSRRGVLDHLDLLNTGVPWIFDDTNRSFDYKTMLKFCHMVGKEHSDFQTREKRFSVIQ